MTRPAPPSGGDPPPEVAVLDGGRRLQLGSLAEHLTERYFDEFPDDDERLGPAGRAWCEHDTRYLLAWALEDATTGLVDTVEQVLWLGRVLVARRFPLDRLVRHVELTAEALEAEGLEGAGAVAAARLVAAADALRGLDASPPD